MPGELAAKLALALACEGSGELDVAEGLYRTCASTDANYVAAAAFGLARIRSARKDVSGAVAALDLVPSTSRSFTEARRLRTIALYESGQGLDSLSQAMSSLQGVRLDPRDSAELTAKILEKALVDVQHTGPKTGVMIGPYAARDESLRDGLELTYRQLAGGETDDGARHALVDKAGPPSRRMRPSARSAERL